MGTGGEGVDLTGRTVVITGGNSGIGRETGVALAGMGAHVVLTARDQRKGEAAAVEARRRSGNDRVETAELDLASFASIRRFAGDLLDRHDRLDVLVNNAGLVLDRRTRTEDGFETTFGVNHLGPFLLTALVRDRLEASQPARIVNVSSTAHTLARNGLDFDDLQSERRYSGSKAYGRSKLANVLFTRELARRLVGTGVTANALHPGIIRSGFAVDGDVRGVRAVVVRLVRPFLSSAEHGARTSVYVASSPELDGVTGLYFDRQRVAPISAAAADDAAALRLWEVSEELVGASGS
ncbi:SDR family oxidoreductase [soil metagenome]